MCLDMDDLHRVDNGKSIVHCHLITPLCIFKLELGNSFRPMSSK